MPMAAPAAQLSAAVSRAGGYHLPGTEPMYTQWFKLSRLPFRLRPEPELLFVGGEFGQAVLRLRALVDGGHSHILLTGEPGSGKSTVLRALADQAGEQRIVVRLWQPDMPPPRLLEALHEQLGLPARRGVAAESLDLLARRIAEENAGGRRLLIMVDDAHELPAATLNQLLRLLALEPPPMLLLAGESNLLELLELRAPNRSPSAPATVELPRLSSADTGTYVRERLLHAGATVDVFEPQALSDIHAYTEGVPALINVLCDAAMNQATARLSQIVAALDVQEAAHALHWVADATVEEAVEPAPADGSGALLLVARRGQPIARLPLATTGSLLIGRTADCDLRLDSSFISRRHCRIVTAGGNSVVEDLDSTNGIAVNGGRHQRGVRHPLSNGDEVRIGDYTLTYVGAETDDEAATRRHG
jgi:type II secretory pathway predicted ATPase ExeA